jgi:hypothetical protein
MSNNGSTIAGGAIATALIEVLVDRGILDLGDGRDVLMRAMRGVSARTNDPGASEAGQIIANLLSGKFSPRSV